jgi:hypothetical protein
MAEGTDFLNLETFLRRRVRGSVAFNVFGSVAALLLGIVVSILTFWLIYGAIWMGFDWLLPQTHRTRLIISGIGLGILFIGNARTDREYLSSYSVDTLDGREAYTIQVPNVGIVSNLNFLSPNTVNSMTKVIAQLLFIGPRLINASWRQACRSFELRRFDVAPSARVAERLRASKGRVPFAELMDVLDAETVQAGLRDLRMLDAIQFLDSKPAGVMLTSDFREELDSKLEV